MNPALQGAREMPGNARTQVPAQGMTAVPMQCDGHSHSHFDRVTQIQHSLRGLNARELQHVFQNIQRMIGGDHQRFVPDRLGDVPPEFGRVFFS